ncbi:MAG: hypothetical protein ABJF10_26445 [Chthoniobacter sp.]|uniref:hypothetical protein n=1 Tax=Chthoniobacter sp. TaxID=2510640 RepID=UPI0032A4F3ED
MAVWSCPSAQAGEAQTPDIQSIQQHIAGREQGNWRGVLEYFEKFPISSPVTDSDLTVWDAYFYLRAETWLERAQQWKNPKAALGDVQKAEQAASAYLNWYAALKDKANGLPKTPEGSPFAAVAAPGRVRFGAAIFGNALLAQGQPDRVISEFGKFPREWIGIEVVRIWKSAAAYEYARTGETPLTDLQLIQNNLSRKSETAAAVKAFASNVLLVDGALAPASPTLPADWKPLVELCRAVAAIPLPAGR